MTRVILVTFVVLVSSALAGQAGTKNSHADAIDTAAPYSDQHLREIKTLSAKDISDLRNGRGWGLAKAAELNGLPGPAHLLELKDEISLSPGQIAKIEALFSTMKARAIPRGEKLVALERHLNESFAANDIASSSALREQLSNIAKVRRDLRFVHLSTHLETPLILTRTQIDSYNRLRGYGERRNHGGHRHD